MTLTTRPIRWNGFARLLRLPSAPPASSSARRQGSGRADLNPTVAMMARPVVPASCDTRVGDLAEMLRMSPYSVVPVVSGADGTLLGLVHEADVSSRLLAADGDAARNAVRQMPINDIMQPARHSLTLFQRAREVSALMDEHGIDTLPALEHEGRFLGLISRADLVYELIRPFRPPVVGGMATPTGVYLTTGSVSGGASAASLVVAGFLMFVLQHAPLFATYPLSLWATRLAGHDAVAQALGGDLLPSLLSIALFFAAVRLSPIAGFHAAEHQVVHAIERSAPLLLENVRAMPRVHPRCGTNLVAGVMICTVVGGILQPIVHQLTPSADDLYLGFVVGAVIALAYWRTVGSYLQQHWTTRPATDAQIESGIKAANELLDRHSRKPLGPDRPLTRLWRMGLLQMVGGFIIGYALLLLVSRMFPGVEGWVKPLLLS